MERLDEQLILSASDLINFLECEHLTALDVEKAQGRLDSNPKRPDTSELVTQKGEEHERSYLESLRAQHGEALVEVETDGSYSGLLDAAQATEDGMRAGAPVIFQATFVQERWRGHADFLERVERPSGLGEWSYEVIDTKLARSVKPYFIVQLCLYSELLSRLQGTDPEQIHVVLGTGERQSFALAEFAAYYRRMKDHFVRQLADGLRDTYPDPVPHCGLCRWSDLCDQRRSDDDHLSLVARMSRPQITKLNRVGVMTVAQFAGVDPAKRPSGIGQVAFLPAPTDITHAARFPPPR